MIKTFRGKLGDGGQHTLNLHTRNGSTGYRIVKFEIMGPDGNTNLEAVVKIYKVETTPSTVIDFSDPTLIGSAIINDTSDPHYLPSPAIIFDKDIFNQDIYVTSKCHDNVALVNYYIELELMKLNENENTVATLKDIRANVTTQ